MKNSGFTLIEILIYIALFSILMLGLVTSAIQIEEYSGYTETQAQFSDESTFILEKVSSAVTRANSIRVPLPDESSASLTVATPEGIERYEVLSGILFRFQDLMQTQVSSNEVFIEEVSYTHVSAQPDDPQHMKVSIRISTRTSNGRILKETFEKYVYDLPK